MGRLRLIAAAGLLWLAAQPAAADSFEEVRGWLERMAIAMQERDYQGTFVYVRGEDVETIRLTHLRRDGKTLERMVAVSGPEREIIRDSDGVRALIGEQGDPLQDPLLTGTVFPDISVASLEHARERYRFAVGDLNRIAGHNGRRITITPTDTYRYGYELWLEEESALLLRWVLLDESRRTLAKLVFTELVTGEAVNQEELRSELPGSRFVAVQAPAPRPRSAAPSAAQSAAHSSASRAPARPLPGGLPPGFGLAAQARNEEQPDWEHLVFSDGLASVSVYLEPAMGEGGIPPGLSRMGTTNAWSGAKATRRVTAIGEVPPVTLKAIGKAFLADRPGADGPE